MPDRRPIQRFEVLDELGSGGRISARQEMIVRVVPVPRTEPTCTSCRSAPSSARTVVATRG